jgi:hypothetical protein
MLESKFQHSSSLSFVTGASAADMTQVNAIALVGRQMRSPIQIDRPNPRNVVQRTLYPSQTPVMD